MQTDMTAGKPMKMVLGFTIPVFLGNVFQQLYSMADAVIVGKFVGTGGLAAVGYRYHQFPYYWFCTWHYCRIHGSDVSEVWGRTYG